MPASYTPPDLHGKVALVVGASPGAGRGIAVALGEAERRSTARAGARG